MRDITPLVAWLKQYIELHRDLFDQGKLTIKGAELIANGWTREEIQEALTQAEKQALTKSSTKKKAMVVAIIAVVVILLLLNNAKWIVSTSNQSIDLNSKGVPYELIEFIESNGTKGLPYVVVKGNVSQSEGGAKNQNTILDTSMNVTDELFDSGGSSPSAASTVSEPVVLDRAKSTCEFDFINDRVIIDCDSASLGKFLKETFNFIKGW